MRLSIHLSWILTTVLTFTLPTAADEPDDAAVDGISILMTNASSDGNQVLIVLQSDVELIRILLLIDRYGATWSEHVEEDVAQGRFRARRLAMLIRMLSTAARVLEDVPDPAGRDKVLSTLRQRAGGRRAFKQAVDHSGASMGDVKNWIAEMLLARRQLESLADQLGPQSDATATADAAYRELESNRALKDALNNWLNVFLNRGEVHFADTPSP